MDGHIYAGVPPLYRISLGKDNYVYLKDDKELADFKRMHSDKRFEIGRLKGLGEMSPDDTKILVDPDRRILKRITVEDIQATDSLFDNLMGDAVTPRKNYIKEHSAEATYSV